MTDRRRSSKVKGSIEFVDLGDREAPPVRVEIVDRSGRRSPLKLGRDGSFELDAKRAGKGLTVRFTAEDGSGLRRYRYDTLLARVADTGVVRLSPAVWGRWMRVRTCVNGSVQVCRPLLPRLALGPVIAQVSIGSTAHLEQLLLDRSDIGIVTLPERCLPVCHGKVEVFLRTCCCKEIGILDPPYVIEDLCKIIDCRFPIPERRPPVGPWPPVGPIDPTGPIGPVGPRPPVGPISPMRPVAPSPVVGRLRPGAPSDADESVVTAGPVTPRVLTGDEVDFESLVLSQRHAVVQATAKALKRTAASGSESDLEEIVEAGRHLIRLLELSSREEQIRYIEQYPSLRWRLCTCDSEKVAETELGPDGSFDVCFDRTPLLKAGCTQTVMYRVSQLQEGSWVVVYDGPVSGEGFDFDDDPVLDAGPLALACDEPWDYPDGIRPFVALEKIGHTGSHELIPVTVPGPNPDPQDGETSFVPLQPKYGLVHEAPSASPPLTSGPFEQPWAGTLRLYYQFHPGLADAPLNAKYYRTRVVRVNDAGNAVSEFVHGGNLSWEKWFFDGTDYRTKWVPLHTDPAVVGEGGLYEIPFFDALEPWVGLQWHAHINTLAKNPDGSRKMPDGRYLFVVDIFDGSGNRLVPADGFDYRRRIASSSSPTVNTRVVAQDALAHLFLVDNVPAVADIEALKQDGGDPSGVNCQYLSGVATSQLQVQYEAQQSTGYQWRHWLRVRKGLHGPNRHVSDITSGPSVGSVLSNHDMPGGPTSLTAPMTFQELMGTVAPSKCTFATTLWIETKHTNGLSRRIEAYDRQDTGSFSLEITS